jgi:hypothetical protein
MWIDTEMQKQFKWIFTKMWDVEEYNGNAELGDHQFEERHNGLQGWVYVAKQEIQKHLEAYRQDEFC